jgi:CCR4-NOT transcription complex subunit 6
MVSVYGEGTSEIGDRPIKPGTFTVVSYNVLADLYATNEMYSYCPPWALSWAYRRQNLLKELVGYRADILCLQEVQSDHYEDFFAPELKKHGYAAVYKKKTGEVSQVYTGSSYAIDGCATFFRESRFSLVKKYEVEFNKAALSLSEALGPAASKKAALNRLLKDNVALIVVLEAKEHEGQEAPLQGQSKRQLLCVANTHIHANPELKDVKLWQVHTLLKGLEKIAASADIPMLVAGDFNSVPGSCPHSLLATGRVDPAHPELATDPLGILRPATKLQHQLPLVSAYGAFARVPGPTGEGLRRKIDPATQEPLFTNCTRDFLGTLDYIFYTADSLQPEALLELLNEEDLRKDTGLPSPEWSSDHIALLAEFRYKPRQRR